MISQTWKSTARLCAAATLLLFGATGCSDAIDAPSDELAVCDVDADCLNGQVCSYEVPGHEGLGKCVPDAGTTTGDDGGSTTDGGTTDGDVCVPVCSGKQCGPNGCGGVCGSCGSGAACDDAGQCVDLGVECDPGCPEGQICTSEGDCVPGACTPDCADKDCGSDGCGGICGANNGGCLKPLQCSDPIMGGVCEVVDGGTTDGGDDGVCEPNCSGKHCGPDGCGGNCGTGCESGQVCSVDQLCVQVGVKCDPACADDEVCNSDGVCVPGSCTADCSNKDCGSDGCGGICGSNKGGCPENSGLVCTDPVMGGACVFPDTGTTDSGDTTGDDSGSTDGGDTTGDDSGSTDDGGTGGDDSGSTDDGGSGGDDNGSTDDGGTGGDSGGSTDDGGTDGGSGDDNPPTLDDLGGSTDGGDTTGGDDGGADDGGNGADDGNGGADDGGNGADDGNGGANDGGNGDGGDLGCQSLADCLEGEVCVDGGCEPIVQCDPNQPSNQIGWAVEVSEATIGLFGYNANGGVAFDQIGTFSGVVTADCQQLCHDGGCKRGCLLIEGGPAMVSPVGPSTISVLADYLPVAGTDPEFTLAGVILNGGAPMGKFWDETNSSFVASFPTTGSSYHLVCAGTTSGGGQ